MAALSAGVAGDYAGYLTQRGFLGEGARKAKLKSAHARAGRRVKTELSALRGPLMKLGQHLSLQTSAVPAEFIEELAALQMQAPPMHPSLVRAQFKASMGAEPEKVFRSFESEAFAAASLGQVHRAVTWGGRRVAVKIQYPGIRDAIASDVSLARQLTIAAGLTGHVKKIVLDEIEAQMLAETDYGREADNIDFFRAGLAPLGYVSVPEVHRDCSGDRVLTMSLLGGEPLTTYLERQPSQAERDRLGTRLLELFYYQLLELQAFHADPHWGNYLFGAGETIGMVDFGCVKRLTPEFVANLRAVYLYAGDRRSAEFRRLLAARHPPRGTRLTRRAERALVDLAAGFYGRVYPPEAARENEAFDFGDPEALREYLRQSAELFNAGGLLPEYTFLARAESGLYQTLHRLRARVPASKVVRRFLHRKGA
jgi:predicted unusual protein kinase regulating ubiquinone biosynthesis (AarF/ABC1/UbiB family)